MKSISLIWLIFFLTLPFHINAQASNVRIACIGNSITYGSHLSNPATESYPSQLTEMLTKKYGDTCQVRNFGLSGRNMLKNGDDPIWVESKFKQALAWSPDICLILLGTNDSPPDAWSSDGNEFLSDYLSMIDTFTYRNPEVQFIICAPTPIWEGHPYGGDTWGEKHNDSIMVNYIIPAIRTVSERREVLMLDFRTPFVDHMELFPDRLHPDPTGAHQIAEIIYEAINKNDMIHKAITD